MVRGWFQGEQEKRREAQKVKETAQTQEHQDSKIKSDDEKELEVDDQILMQTLEGEDLPKKENKVKVDMTALTANDNIHTTKTIQEEKEPGSAIALSLLQPESPSAQDEKLVGSLEQASPKTQLRNAS